MWARRAARRRALSIGGRLASASTANNSAIQLLSRNFGPIVTARLDLAASCGGPIPPAIYTVALGSDHDSFCNLPTSCREARHPIKQSMDLRPPLVPPGYLACEAAALRGSRGVASNTDALPVDEQGPL